MTPEGWQEFELGAVSAINMGQSPPSSSYNSDGVGLPFLQGNADFGSRYPVVRTWCDEPTKKADAGAILISVRAPVGKLNIAATSVCIGRGLAAITATRSDCAFLYQYLQFSEPNLERLAQGSTFSAISGPQLRGFSFLLPPLPEQRKIAAMLSSVDACIEKTEAMIAKLQDLKQALMQELLTKGLQPEAAAKHGIKKSGRFKDSPLGKIPEEWEVVRLGGGIAAVIDGDRGKEYPKESDFMPFGYCLFLSAKNVTRSGFSFSECQFISQEKCGKLRKGLLKRGDLVLTTRGTIGNTAYFDSAVPFENIRINSGMVILRLSDNGSTNVDYLYLLVRAPVVQRQIELLTFGSAQPQLTVQILNDLFLGLPSIKEQSEISKAFKSLDHKIATVKTRLQQLNQLKKALMQVLLTGRVRVKVDEAA